jgi:hypothetical protein
MRTTNWVLRRLPKTAGAFLLAWIFTASLSAQTVRITSPAEGTVFHPGQTMNVTADATPLAFKTVIAASRWPIRRSPPLASPPYQFRMPIPLDIVPGPYPLTAVGVTHAGIVIGSMPIRVAIERPDAPQALASDASMDFDHLGASVNLVVYGRGRAWPRRRRWSRLREDHNHKPQRHRGNSSHGSKNESKKAVSMEPAGDNAFLPNEANSASNLPEINRSACVKLRFDSGVS